MENITLDPALKLCPSFLDVVESYRNDAKFHEDLWRNFRDSTNSIQYLKAHRDFIENSNRSGVLMGCGDRSFQYCWHLLVQQMPASFKFLELGVFNGQILSLVKLASTLAGKKATITGITPLVDKDLGFEEQRTINRLQLIQGLFNVCEIEFDPSDIIDGVSYQPWIYEQAIKRGPYEMIYIDAGHEYQDVLVDFLLYAPLLRPGGFLVMDDASCLLKLPPRKHHHPDDIHPGCIGVSEMIRDVLDNNPNYTHLFAIGHLRVYQKRDVAPATSRLFL